MLVRHGGQDAVGRIQFGFAGWQEWAELDAEAEAARAEHPHAGEGKGPSDSLHHRSHQDFKVPARAEVSRSWRLDAILMPSSPRNRCSVEPTPVGPAGTWPAALPQVYLLATGTDLHAS